MSSKGKHLMGSDRTTLTQGHKGLEAGRRTYKIGIQELKMCLIPPPHGQFEEPIFRNLVQMPRRLLTIPASILLKNWL